MDTKSKRQQAILRLIQNEALDLQEDLLKRLHSQGIPCTQATISRDIRELRLVKERDPQGNTRYVVAAHRGEDEHGVRLKTIFRESVVSFDTAQNLIVLKTMPGLASAAGATLDAMDIPNMVGSIAGDDTVVLIMRTNESAQQFCSEIRRMMR